MSRAPSTTSTPRTTERKLFYALMALLIIDIATRTWSQGRSSISMTVMDRKNDEIKQHARRVEQSRQAQSSTACPLSETTTKEEKKTRAHSVDNSTLPGACGMTFFYHIPSTGGATINQWLMKYTDAKNKSRGLEYDESKPRYFTSWGRAKDGRGKPEQQTQFIRDNDGGMEAFVKDLGPTEWRISHCHHSSLNLDENEHYLAKWREEVEGQGCLFIAHVMFRDPLSHTMSLFKHLRRFNHTRESYFEHFPNITELGPWQTNLDYFLYNFLARNPRGVSKEAKVKRAMDLLRTHFDIVTLGFHDGHKRELLRRTGWDEIKMPRMNTHPGEIAMTKREVEFMQKILDANGDIDFMESVKYTYRDLYENY